LEPFATLDGGDELVDADREERVAALKDGGVRRDVRVRTRGLAAHRSEGEQIGVAARVADVSRTGAGSGVGEDRADERERRHESDEHRKQTPSHGAVPSTMDAS